MVHSAQDFTEISAEKDLKMSDTESDLHIHPNMAKQQYHHRSQFGDTTFTKLFVGGLAWETPPEEMRKYFQQFGDILEAVIITDKNTGKSKGYGFVTFSDEESARRACDDPNPVIDGRRANCNIASLGRTRPSPPRGGRAQGGGVPVPGAGPPSVAQPPPLMYHHHPSYGYQTYTPDYGYHHQGTMYTPQVQVQVQQAQYYQQQVYGTSSCNSNPYYYVQAPRSAYSSPQLSPGPSYLYYPTTPMNVSFSGYPPPMRQPFPSPTPTDSQAQQRTSFESTARVVITSESSNSQGKD